MSQVYNCENCGIVMYIDMEICGRCLNGTQLLTHNIISYNDKTITDEAFFKEYPQPPLERRCCEPLDPVLASLPKEALIQPVLENQNKVYGPGILRRDMDLMVLTTDDGERLIKSFWTNKIVPNRRCNSVTGYIEIIDPTIEEEDRRLAILKLNPDAILEEDHNKFIYYYLYF